MIFPFSKRPVIKDPFDPIHRLDREIVERGRRLFLGVAIDNGFQKIHSALIVTSGNGKYLRVLRGITESVEIPKETRSFIAQIADGKETSLIDLSAVQEDLASLQVALIEQLKQQAGKYVDRLLAIAMTDPGIWMTEKNLQSNYTPWCDPNRLADATGITTIDAFPIRDILDGGTGTGLEGLPAWLAFSDRSQRSAESDRLFVSVHDDITAYLIPASDGLDIEAPEIVRFEIKDWKKFRHLLTYDSDLKLNQSIARLNLEGHYDAKIKASFRIAPEDSGQTYLEHEIADVVRTSVVATVEYLVAQIKSTNQIKELTEIYLDSSPELLGTFTNELQRAQPDVVIENQFQNLFNQGASSATLTAILGAMTVDQMPANLPTITGAQSQRILGRITPGSPSNWRQLLLEMADFQPPAMRLRDAV
ncbi:MAG: anhydro-N-acetylmuramic acid kinase [Planctomycetota bacterium]